jgi:hypothetical protein
MVKFPNQGSIQQIPWLVSVQLITPLSTLIITLRDLFEIWQGLITRLDGIDVLIVMNHAVETGARWYPADGSCLRCRSMIPRRPVQASSLRRGIDMKIVKETAISEPQDLPNKCDDSQGII